MRLPALIRMNRYDPTIEPKTGDWLNLSETVQNDLVRAYHEKAHEPLTQEALSIHTVLHVVVENQIALKTEAVSETVDRLTRQGLERHEAIHAVAAVLSKDIVEIMHDGQASFSAAAYRRRLEKLTAKRWRKSKW